MKTLFGFLLLGILSHSGLAQENLRASLLASPLTPNLAGDATTSGDEDDPFKALLANSPAEREAVFVAGNDIFNMEWQETPGNDSSRDGLGPVFNEVACALCHVNNSRGAPPKDGQLLKGTALVRFSISGSHVHGGPKPVPNYGVQLQPFGIDGVPAEGQATISYEYSGGQYADGTPYQLRKPIVTFQDMTFGDLPPDLMTSLRVPNQMIGLGLLEIVPDETLLALADEEDANEDGISGRVNRVWDVQAQKTVIGRFSWKANQPSLIQQAASAARDDMGITTSLMPKNNCAEGQIICSNAVRITGKDTDASDGAFDELVKYTQLIAVPSQRNTDDPAVKRGYAHFQSAGCVQCHMPTLVTGEHPEYPEMSRQVIHPFTDLLLHDMGAGLADGRPDFLATGQEWRTAPLWGIGRMADIRGDTNYLHDGRARTLEEAILWHGGEAERAREAFRNMDAAFRDDLLTFLKSL